MNSFFEANRNLWDSRVEKHMASEFYGLESWKAGRNSVPTIDLELLGDISGKSLLHLQCHFGQDSLSLARMGASVTGVDLSPEAIRAAAGLAAETGIPADFICSNVLDIAETVPGQFDIIYTSYGTIGWLPDLQPWADGIFQKLKPGGQFLIVDFHPMLWSLDLNDFSVAYDYFNTGPIVEEVTGSYTDEEGKSSGNKTFTEYGWNHPISDIISPLLERGLTLRHMQEFDYSPWPCFSGLEEIEPLKWKFANRKKEIPMVYAMDFRGPAGPVS